MRSAAIYGLAGEVLAAEEHAFLRETRPAGIILFARNCQSPSQMLRLVDDARRAVAADDILVLIDQEGGRVRRLRPPLWRELPAAEAFAVVHRRDRAHGRRLAFLAARLTASDLAAVGVNTNCAPVLDLRFPGAHDIIGDRSYGSRPGEVADLARAVADGYLSGGVLPVIKHIPGHGRALADSHLELPVVDASREDLQALDFAPFRSLADVPAAMTAHVVYTAIDAGSPASTSQRVIREVIRRHIGFDGLLMSDDLGMRALTGSFRSRAEAVVAAGSDIALHCSGNLEEMRQVAEGVPSLAGAAMIRFDRAVAATSQCADFDVAEAEAALAEVAGGIV